MANNYLPSVFYHAPGKWFAECFSKIHSAKDYCLPSVFRITLGKPIFQRKKIIFFSAYCYCLPSVFRITLGKPIFQRKKISQHIQQLCFFFAP